MELKLYKIWWEIVEDFWKQNNAKDLWTDPEGDIWRIGHNEELSSLMNGEDIVKFIKAQRISLLGHGKRMEVGAMPRRVLEGRLFMERRKGRLRLRWRRSRSESKENKVVEWKDERQRAVETGCWGGQGSPRAVAPRGGHFYWTCEKWRSVT